MLHDSVSTFDKRLITRVAYIGVMKRNYNICGKALAAARVCIAQHTSSPGSQSGAWGKFEVAKTAQQVLNTPIAKPGQLVSDETCCDKIC